MWVQAGPHVAQTSLHDFGTNAGVCILNTVAKAPRSAARACQRAVWPQRRQGAPADQGRQPSTDPLPIARALATTRAPSRIAAPVLPRTHPASARKRTHATGTAATLTCQWTARSKKGQRAPSPDSHGRVRVATRVCNHSKPTAPKLYILSYKRAWPARGPACTCKRRRPHTTS